MSKILYREVAVSFREKSTWIITASILIVYGGYFLVVFTGISESGPREAAYRGVMLATVVVMVILATVSHIVLAIADPRGSENSDERDKDIERRGEHVGGYVLAVGVVAGLALAMFEAAHFLIANALLAGLVLSELVAGSTKLVLYRRGI